MFGRGRVGFVAAVLPAAGDGGAGCVVGVGVGVRWAGV